ncbi:protein-L-isoaspartate(D-aspartate) O-methyltransferase [Magnetococcus sp. PR-3]|uniref:protein-L-isoaspartate(D-aspartate) O-methyltransferase n=1 Tax=Magnetococcus sp. PR-3 TaxID=3120355 RepID=UPI002FCDECD0
MVAVSLKMPTTPPPPASGDRARTRMLNALQERGITDPRVLEVMGSIPRHDFVDEALSGHAYGDATLPIGEGQTLSQPYTVARMSQALGLGYGMHVLEIGTGSGYQTAVLSAMCRRVYTVERIPTLAQTARMRLENMGISNVRYRVGDGTLGWPEPRPFERIIVTAGAPAVPERLMRQLEIGGQMIIPEGGKANQQMIRIHRTGQESWHREVLEACRFVPLVGQQGWE